MWMMAVRAGLMRHYYEIVPEEMCHSSTALPNFNTLIRVFLEVVALAFFDLVFFKGMEKRHNGIAFSLSFHLPH